MSNPFIFLIAFIFLTTSCNGPVTGIYVGEGDSGVKHITSSTLEITENNKFILKLATTSLEFSMPSTSISELHGEYEYKDQKIILIPKESRNSWIQYNKNENREDYKGSRKSAYVAKDTMRGEFRQISDVTSIEYNFTTRSNSIYIWNVENCFMKFIKAETSNDLKNYCDEIKSQKQ